jgi:(R,R)-butanediol dehydrogenase/meso-butanediol dehydrogenase/diacetyl reductase
MMKAAIYHTPGKPLSIERIPVPQPLEDEVLIRVGRCGICGSDLSMTSGQGPGFPTGGPLGHEYAGEIVALGAGVSHLRVGQRITAMPAKGCGQCAACLAGRPLICSQMQMMMGGFAEYTRVDVKSAVVLPEALSLADGALVEPLACSLRGVAISHLPRNSKVLVLGAGSIGLGAVYWARRMGAGIIACSARSTWRADLALAQGADHFLTADAELDERCLEAFGQSPDLVFECTGAPGMLNRALQLVRHGGQVIVLGLCPGHDQFVPALAAFKDISLRFTTGYDLEDFHHVVDTLERGHLQPRQTVGATITLAALPETLEAMRQQQTHCKVLVDPTLSDPNGKGDSA